MASQPNKRISLAAAGIAFLGCIASIVLCWITGGFVLFIICAVISPLIGFFSLCLYFGVQRRVVNAILMVGRHILDLLAVYFVTSSRAALDGASRAHDRIGQWYQTFEGKYAEAKERQSLRRQEVMERRVAAIQPVQISRSFGHDMA
jgi:hypothetical protein